LIRMDAGKSPKRKEAEHVGEMGRRELRWENCVTRDMRRFVKMESGEGSW